MQSLIYKAYNKKYESWETGKHFLKEIFVYSIVYVAIK